MSIEQWPTIRRIDDPQEHVTKFVYEKDDAVAESVLYRYPTYRERTVICCSTQSGCPVGCRFCGAGDSFVRSLTVDEIVAQPLHCLSQVDCLPEEMGRLQIMFMSMGEPLLNQRALIPALKRLYGLYPNAALLISTAAPAVSYEEINAISQRIPTIGLQFSIHESTDEARDRLIPYPHKLNLRQIKGKGEDWYRATCRKPFFNYCAHDGNVSQDDVYRIRELFDPGIWCATVSVVCERSQGLPATNEHQRELATTFGNKLFEAGYDTRVFDPAGQDTIGGGCGQLWFVQSWMADHADLARPSVGRGLDVIHAPVACG